VTKLIEPGTPLLWRREHRSRPVWWTHVRFLRLAGAMMAVVADPGDNERRVRLENLYRERFGTSLADPDGVVLTAPTLTDPSR
jgi:hypothetical protein